MSDENKSEQTPWEQAVDMLRNPDWVTMTWSELIDRVQVGNVIKIACERHAADLCAENERLRNIIDAGKGQSAVSIVMQDNDRLTNENAALAAKVEQLATTLRLAQTALDEVKLHHGEVFSGTTLDQVNAALADAPPPAVVPAADVEPLLKALGWVSEYVTSKNIDVTAGKARRALAAYHSKHPKK